MRLPGLRESFGANERSLCSPRWMGAVSHLSEVRRVNLSPVPGACSCAWRNGSVIAVPQRGLDSLGAPLTVRTARQSAYPLMVADARDRQAGRVVPGVPTFRLTRNGPVPVAPDSSVVWVDRLARLHGCRAASVRQRLSQNAGHSPRADYARFGQLWALASSRGTTVTTDPVIMRWLAGTDPTGDFPCRYSALIGGVPIDALY